MFGNNEGHAWKFRYFGVFRFTDDLSHDNIFVPFEILVVMNDNQSEPFPVKELQNSLMVLDALHIF